MKRFWSVVVAFLLLLALPVAAYEVPGYNQPHTIWYIPDLDRPEQQVGCPAQGYFPTSPDGNFVVYVSPKYGSLRACNMTTWERYNLWRGVPANPQFDWQGKRVVFNEYEQGSDLWVYNIQTKEITRVTSTPEIECEAEFSPDGKQIVFTSRLAESGQPYAIYVMDADGQNRKLLFSFPTRSAGDPSFSPDGKLITFRSSQGIPDGGYIVPLWGSKVNIWVMNADGTNPRQLTKTPGDYTNPQFDNTGRYIYFNKFVKYAKKSPADPDVYRFAIWRIDVETGEVGPYIDRLISHGTASFARQTGGLVLAIQGILPQED